MEDSFENIFEKPFRPYKDMSRKELEDELERWRNLWTWHEEVLTYWLTKVRSYVKVKLRNFTFIEGLLGQPHFEIKSIDIDTTERIYNYARGEATYETKTVTVPLSQLVDLAFVHVKEVIKEEISGAPLNEAGLPVSELDLSKEV